MATAAYHMDTNNQEHADYQVVQVHQEKVRVSDVQALSDSVHLFRRVIRDRLVVVSPHERDHFVQGEGYRTYWEQGKYLKNIKKI